MTDVDALVRAADPVPVRPAFDDAARAGLDAILATPVRRTRRWPVLAAAAGVVVLALGAGVVADVVPHPVRHARHAGYTPTPVPLRYRPVAARTDAAAYLRSIADRVAALPDDAGRGRYAHLAQRGWALNTRVDGFDVRSEIVVAESESWRDASGAGRSVVTWTAPGHEPVRERHTLRPGDTSFLWPLGSLSADDATLRRQLALGHPAANGPAERIVAVLDAVREAPFSPAVRAALLRYLAGTAGLRVEGEVTDRAGRDGVAFSLDSDHGGLPVRQTVVVDPADGRILDEEELLTEDAGLLNVPIPSVISYTVFRTAEYTDSLA